MNESTRELLARDRVRVRHRFEYAAFRAVLAGSVRLSDARAAAVGSALGRLGHALGIKRAVVERNLHIAFPHESDAWRAAIARESYEHLGRETMMTLRLATMTREQLIERTRAVNADVAIDALHRGGGVVVVAGHIGNWEIGAAMMTARGHPVDAIAKRAGNPLFYENVLAARERLGVTVIDYQHATRQALGALRAGRAVAFAADQHAGRAGLRVPFFGRPVSAFRGPALMSLRTGAPMFLSITLRQPDGTYENTFEQVAIAQTGDMDADVLRLTTAYMARLEAAVRSNPGQYLWQHRRWRDLPSRGPAEEPDTPAEV